ncbi:MAG: bactofilin family protein [Hyphomicrobiaceae bacterium]
MLDNTFVVGPDVRIWGTVKSGGPVYVLGFVDGGILAPEVVVTQQAMVTGDIIATKASVAGQVTGNIFADDLILEAGADIDGDIYHTTLNLFEGAHFEGKSRRHEKPKLLAPTLSVYEYNFDN